MFVSARSLPFLCGLFLEFLQLARQRHGGPGMVPNESHIGNIDYFSCPVYMKEPTNLS